MERSKVILGLKHPVEFSKEEMVLMIEEWLSSGKTKQAIWFKYTGQPQEHGKMLCWMRSLGYEVPVKLSRLASSNIEGMSKLKVTDPDEIFQLREKVKQLERALVQSELRSTVLETIIEVAEQELKINIKKKSYTK
jgi:hypothetical protein